MTSRSARLKTAFIIGRRYSETERHNLTVLASRDGGQHFTKSLVLVPGEAGYSSIACGFAPAHGPGADCAALYSASDGVRIVRFKSADLS